MPRCGCSSGVPTGSLGVKRSAIQPCTPSGKEYSVNNDCSKVKSEVDREGFVYLKPQVSLSVAGSDRVFLTSDATVDTGLTGWLALPEDRIQELGLTSYGERPANQADGVALFLIYGALVLWHGGRRRPVLVHQIIGDPLLGMALL